MMNQGSAAQQQNFNATAVPQLPMQLLTNLCPQALPQGQLPPLNLTNLGFQVPGLLAQMSLQIQLLHRLNP